MTSLEIQKANQQLPEAGIRSGDWLQKGIGSFSDENIFQNWIMVMVALL